MYCVFIILSVGLSNDSKCKKYLWEKFGTFRDGSKCFSGRFRDGGEKNLILTPANMKEL